MRGSTTIRNVVRVFIAAASVAISAAAAPPPVQLFTGVLRHDGIRASQLARLHLVSYLRPGSTSTSPPVTSYSAVLSLHWGSFKDPEYVALYYNTVKFNAQTQEYLLLPDPSTETGGKLPTVRLRYEGTSRLAGTYTSPTFGAIGKLELTAGTEAPPEPAGTRVLKPLGGIYEGDCAMQSGGTRLRAIELRPSRLSFGGRTPPEAALSAVNYLGTTACDFGGLSGGALACASFHPGIYNFYRDEIRLFDDVQAVWTCRRAGDDGLSCDGPYVKQCSLKRAPARGERKHRAADPTPVPAAFGSGDAPPEKPLCGAWDGAYRGILRHAATGREQYVALKLTTILLSGPQPPVRCALQGSADLVFGPDANGREYFSSILPEVEIIPNRPDEVLFSEKEGDVIVQMAQPGTGKIEGNWYSKRYGFVGSFTVTSGGEPLPALADPVAGLAGDYVEMRTGYRLAMAAVPGAPDPKATNPYNQISITGWEDIPSMRIPIHEVSYDYFNDALTVDLGGRFFFGRLEGLNYAYRILMRKYQSPSYVGTTQLYRRP